MAVVNRYSRTRTANRFSKFASSDRMPATI
jgi:hypothetical protein